MGKNGYLQRQKARDSAYRVAAADTERQFMVDLFCLVLNDRETMGKNALGLERLRRVVTRVMEEYQVWEQALTGGPEADYYQEKLDIALARIMGDELVPFKERYDWVKIAETVRRRKK